MHTGGDGRRPSALEDECEQHKELVLELAEESKTALSDRIRDVEQENKKLVKDNSLLVKKVQELKASLREKRERLWDEIQDFQDALGEKKKELQEALDSKAEHRREASALRVEVVSLQQQQTSLSQSTAKSNEEARQATEKQNAQQEELACLGQLLRGQQASFFSQATAQAYEEARQAKQKQSILQETVTQLEQRLQEQSKAFEKERAQLLKQAASSQNAQGELGSSLDQAIPQLRSLLTAYDRIRGCSADKQTKTTDFPHSPCTTLSQFSNPDLAQRFQEQQLAFDREREKLLEHASDAAKTQQGITLRALMEREAVLTCPISLELFDFPVVTGCCGKTFSSEALRQAVKKSPLCPLCRGRLSSTHPNRDMTKLIELHKAERSVLGVPEPATSSSTAPTSQNNDYARISTGSSSHSHRSRRSTGNSSTRESRHRDNRGERIQARSAVPYHRSSRTRTQANASPGAPSIALPSPSVDVVANTTPTATNQQVQPPPSGLTVVTIGSEGTRTPVPRHMVRSVMASLRFPSAQSRSTARGRRHRSRSRTASSAVTSTTEHTGVHQQIQSTVSRRRALRTGTVSSAASSSTTPAVSNSGSQSRVRSTISRPNPSTALGAPTSAASVGPVASMDVFMNAWLRAHPAPAAASPPTSTAARNISRGQVSRPNAASTTPSTAVSTMSAPVLVSSGARMAASTSTSVTATASHRPARMFASQDDSAVGRQQHDSLRLTASQPAPREPLSIIAKSISSLRDLLGSDFEDSDSNSN